MKALAEKLESAPIQAVVAKPWSNPDLAALSSGIAICMGSFVETMGTTVAAFVPGLAAFSVTMVESALISSSVIGAGNDALCDTDWFLHHGKISMKKALDAGAALGKGDDGLVGPFGGDNVEERSKLGKQFAVTIAESGLKVCETILDRLPNFFGQSNIYRLATLAARTGFKPLNYALVHAASCMKPSVLLFAIAGALKSCEACADATKGTILMMQVLEKMVVSMKKSEVKSMKEEVLTLCLAGLEHRARVLRNSRSWDPSAGSLRSVHDVERATASAVLAFVLRLPEVEFKPLFNKVLEWNEAETLPDELRGVARESPLEITTNVFRANATYVVLSALFDSLRALFAPYFAQILDRTLGIVCTKFIDSPEKGVQTAGKKRKRISIEGGEKGNDAAEFLVSQQRELINAGLTCIAQFLRRAPEGVPMASAVVHQVLEALLTAFDNCRGASYECVLDAFCALGSRIVCIGGLANHGEESRQMLGALSRGLLLRTREEDGQVRATACDGVRRVASTVGDEYLVTLPEAMPFLADLVDDEDEAVESCARKLVQLLETLSGEPILEQLKS
jgi:BP28CT (NUC211) domain